LNNLGCAAADLSPVAVDADLEANSSPGLEGIEQATGKDIAGKIIQFIEDNAVKGKTKTRGKG